MIYIIYESSKINEIQFSEVIENNQNTLRLSVDGTQTILKFKGNTPTFLDGYTQYSHSEILEIINNPDNGWIDLSNNLN